ncbi:MAG: hypothetical protein PCFJNLEI_01590 [Verrucomicrobiae bacterium]|nr:hypothetical protein [Verrucomicrobiae bacterium]
MKLERCELPADADVWVLAGQSNMAGSGFGEACETPDPRVWLYTLQDQWKIAEEPFAGDRYEAVDEAFAIMRGEREKHRADPNYRKQMAATWRAAGSGLGLPFGKIMTAFTGKPVGLLFCAKGDTRMEEWTPDYDGPPDMALYRATLRRIRKVGRPIKGILWMQGESDSFGGKAQHYVARMKKLVADFRRDLNQPDLPFFYSQIATFALQTEEELPDWNLLQDLQRQLEPTLAPGGMCVSVDLPLCDWGHIATGGLKRLGRRFATIVRRNLYGDTRLELGPRPVAVERDSSDARLLHVRYSSVNGTLFPKDRVAGFVVQWSGEERNRVCTATVSSTRDATVTLICTHAVPAGSTVRYGKGLLPFCNLTDAADMAAPVFGPWTV